MNVNSSTNSVEAERCLDLLVNQLISSQYWQGTIRSHQIKNCVSLFNRYLRLSNQQDFECLTEEIRNRVANEVIFNEFLTQLSTEDASVNSSWQFYKNKFINFLKKLTNFHLIFLNYIEKIESFIFNLLPEILKNSIIPSYRRPLILLYLLNVILFILRLTVFNSRPIFNSHAKIDRYSANKIINKLDEYNYPTFLEIVYEVLMFLVNLLTSIIPLVLPIITLHFMNRQNIQN
ncbi:uncharacterized protein cubi_01843 [Cryptosporidium ubiquitum]|uniref:Uncharacterized protein n=1 Tax=Cryptosporidium ubiquitum TaxID=857276 RepID=A0A1J4MM26_9CRYT|nr:uncharacterized protein cubi_01843 [Cryptosporidium ubiquitum]OII75322.1 hypothetical protein cubi_01843 [Cryptosporidium ubiquitum]